MSQDRRGIPRVEDAALLTGNGRYLADLDPIPGALSAAIVRSPHPHARITGFDAEAALQQPGVVAVLGPDDVAAGLRPFPLSVKTPMPYRPAATDRVRYVGEPVAVVVATDRYRAEDAAELVQVDYELLPVVATVADALAEQAPLLHPDAGSNVATDRTFTFGAVDEAFEAAESVVTGEFSFPRYSSTPMETYVVVAEWSDDGTGPSVTAWANFHGPFTMVPVLAGALGLPLSRLRLVVPADIGGSYGIKSGVYPYVALLALAAKKAGAPVRWVEDRTEHLLASSAGCDREMRFTAAVDADGKISALDVDLIDNVGAYLRPPEPSTLYRCFGNTTGAYTIPTLRMRSRAVVTNKAPTGLNRGFGGQQLYFGLERIVDKVAAALQVDPAEYRRRNFVPADAFPYQTPSGGVYDSGNYQAAFDLALQRADYSGLRAEQAAARAEGRLVGIGIASIVEPSGTNIGYVGLATPADQRGRAKSGSTELVTISVDAFGQVTVVLGTVPQGQGHATVARQVVADRLGLPLDQVRAVVEMDTATTPWTVTSGSYSSRFSPLLTSALCEACDVIAHRLKAAASVLLGVAAENLELAEGMVRIADSPDKGVPVRHAAGVVHWDPGSLSPDIEPRLHVQAAFAPPEATAPTADDRINSSLCYGFGVNVVLVEIDRETLELNVRKVVSVHDAGTILAPVLFEGQVLGAMAQALGGATLEELRYGPDGQPTATTFADYLCPKASDMDFDIVLDHIETPSPFTTLGAKGAGEGESMSLPAALANAVSDALAPLGIEIDRLPVHGSMLDDLLSSHPSPTQSKG